MSEAMHSAAALAFLGDKLDLDAVEALCRNQRLRLAPARDGAAAFAHLNGDPDALVAELLRLARFGVLVGIEANLHPDRMVGDVVLEAERRQGREA